MCLFSQLRILDILYLDVIKIKRAAIYIFQRHYIFVNDNINNLIVNLMSSVILK